MSESKRHGPLPGCPSRHDMVQAAIFMERRGFDWNEWPVVARLCDSDLQIRHYILAFAKECLDAWEGLAPSRGRFSYEIAAIAASNAYVNAYKELQNSPKEYVSNLMEPPAPWTEQEQEAYWMAYQQRHPHRCRITSKLKEVLEQETAAVYCEPHTTPSGCVIIPFKAADMAGKAVFQ